MSFKNSLFWFRNRKPKKLLKKCWFTKGVRCAGVKCDHLRLEVRARVRAHLHLDVRGACVRPKKRSQPMTYWQILIWKAGGFAYLEIRQSLTCNTVGQQVDRPSSIYSCSLGHILEHEFFCLGRLGSSGSKERKWIWVILSNFWKWVFQLFAGKKKFKIF